VTKVMITGRCMRLHFASQSNEGLSFNFISANHWTNLRHPHSTEGDRKAAHKTPCWIGRKSVIEGLILGTPTPYLEVRLTLSLGSSMPSHL
jgi:hypothetical protein